MPHPGLPRSLAPPGRTSAAEACSETRANYVIYKDIDVVAQLEKALNKIFTPAGR